MIISMTESIRLIYTKPSMPVSRVNLSNQGRVDSFEKNKSSCLDIIRDGQLDLNKIASKLSVNRLTIIRYCKKLHEDGLIMFICSNSEVTRIEKAI